MILLCNTTYSATTSITWNKPLTGEDESLLVWRDSFLILNLSLDVLDRVGGLHFQGDRFPSQCLDEYLHPAAESEDQMESALLLNVVVGQSASILKLLS